MDKTEQIRALGIDLNTLCQRYINEFDMELASVIGCLHIESQVLIDEVIRDFDAKEDQRVIDEEGDDSDEGDSWKSQG